MGSLRHIVLLFSVLAVVPAGPLAANDVLLGLGPEFDTAKVPVQDAKVSRVPPEGGGGLRVETGHKAEWPGITLAAPAGKWDLSRLGVVELDLRNPGPGPVAVCCRVDNPGADGVKNCITATIDLKPGQAGMLRIPIPRRMPGGLTLFGMRGYPEGWDPKGGLDPSNVTQLVVFVNRPKADQVFEIAAVRAAAPVPQGAPVAASDFFPCIDTFGQYLHRDWPGKVHSLSELQARRTEEEKVLAQRPGPGDWDRFGGWSGGPELKATGHFRVQKHQGKWWLVDPEGRLFFSHGIDCVRMLDMTPIDGREAWFQGFPGDLPEFKKYLAPEAFALHGHYAGKRPRCFNFAAANLERKYGPEWRRESEAMAHRRLRSWGLNTVANWSDSAVYLMGRTPYVSTLHTGGRMIEGSEGYWGKFPDPFDLGFGDHAKKTLTSAAARTARDPFCIGYFVDNEMSWGDAMSLAEGALRSPPDQAAKQAFLEDLKAKYVEVDRLNKAWGTKHASWEALAAAREAPGRDKARADLSAFYTRIAERYFDTVRGALREAAPEKLYLGCRFAWANPLAVAAAVKSCDVVSFNLYQRSVADFKLPVDADVPLIIGEFHFGALDRGMFHTGLVPVPDQAARAKAYKDYVMGCVRHPAFVGCHWFQYQDEPTTGRVYDEENYQIGFIDTVDTPYRETVDAAREVGYGMYPLRLEQ